MSHGMAGKSPFKIIIIGGGLAGSCLANGLIRNDINVQVYERLSENSEREGYQITMGSAALEGMRACLSQDQLQSIVEKFGPASGSKSSAPAIYNRDFEQMLNLSMIPNYNKSAPVSRLVLRDALAAPVALAGRLKYDARYERYEIRAPGTVEERVRVWFQDGSFDDCDVLIAADGSHSRVNSQIALNNLHSLQRHTSMLAKNVLPTQRYLDISQRIGQQSILTFADNKSLYFCAYLPKVATKPGLYDESLSSSFFGLHVPPSECPPNLAELSNEEKWKFVSATLRAWAPEYHEIIDLVKGPDLYVYQGRYSTQPAKNWRSAVRSETVPEQGHPRVWLMGDAMHAMLPNRGMGGNTAMCDTATALPLLTRLSCLASTEGRVSTIDVTQACAKYEAEMIPRAFDWVRKSGGGNMVPIDTGKWWGILALRFASLAMHLAYYWYMFLGLFTSQKYIDEAPELKE